MKIEFKIPSFIPPERIIHIIAGSYERIGYVEPNTRKVYMKTSRCSRCARCCNKLGCDKLVFKDGLWQCINGEMPLICVVGYGKGIPECTVKYGTI